MEAIACRQGYGGAQQSWGRRAGGPPVSSHAGESAAVGIATVVSPLPASR